MEAPTSGADSQSSDQTQPIHEIDGDGGLKIAAGPVDAADGADLVKKKRGRPPRVQAKSPPVKMNKEEDEDVCFICFDGGSLVLCDRRGCPKAYHPACVKRDEAFFQSTAKWNCGWHICSTCQKAAHHMCYTCTYSLCKGCIKKADYVCVRGDKGFCAVCMKTIMLIENGGQEKDEKAQVDFDDKTSWEYLFKVYWVYLKGKLSLTIDELTQAKNPWKKASTTAAVIPSTCAHNGVTDQKSVSLDMPPQSLEASESKRRKTDEEISIPQKENVITKKSGSDERSSVIACKDWATKELLDFVSHMKSGDTSVLSQFDVQELMLEYIKRNNLRDPRKKSQIICDSRLKILFGKPRVGHFEMLKLLEFHFFINEDLSKKAIKSIARQVDPDWSIDNMVTVGKDKKRKNHKKVEEHLPQNKLDDYAAIDVHNMNLIYLRRKLMENLIENSEEFHGKVVGSIVRIRITGSGKKHDMYRLVQVVGVSKADAPYKIGDKSADVMLEVLNLDKKETVSVETISNQDLSEDECRRLRQSIRCGLVKRFTGDIQDKAMSLQPLRLNDLMEAETLRLTNLRDRASEKGHKKRYPFDDDKLLLPLFIFNFLLILCSLTSFTLREYVEKLQLLKTPEERERRLREILEVHSDPKMNPDYESDDTEEYFNKEHGWFLSFCNIPLAFNFKYFSSITVCIFYKYNPTGEHTKPQYSGISGKSSSSVNKGKEYSNNVDSRLWKNEEGSTKATGRINMKKDARWSTSSGQPQSRVDYNSSKNTNQNQNSASETSTSSYSMKNTSIPNSSESDKIWHYRDPSGKIQGPFCMVQLQKWSTTGYFPQNMRIWTNQEDDSLLLNDVLNQQMHNKTATKKVSIRIKGLTVCTTNLSPTQNSVNHEKISDTHGSAGQSAVQKWIGNGNTNTPSLGKSNESNMTDLASPTPAGKGNCADVRNISSFCDIANAGVVDLPSPTPKETMNCEDEKVQNAVVKEAVNGGAQLPKPLEEWSGYSPTQVKPSPTPKETMTHEDEKVQNTVVKEAGNGGAQLPKTLEEWSGYSPTQVKLSPTPKETMTCEDEKVQNAVVKEVGNGEAQLPETVEDWSGYSPTQIKREESHSEGDRVVTTSANMEQVIPSSSPPPSQPGYNCLPEWQGVRETIEFSTLAEESVSDLLAEVDAMESQNGFPSPTSRRNNFVEDLFNGSFEEFSPTPVQGARSDAFNSNEAEIHLPFQPPTTATTTTVGVFEGNASNVSADLQFKWPDTSQETIYKDVIDVNNSVKADEREREANASKTSHERAGGSNSNEHDDGEHTESTTTNFKDSSSEFVLPVRTDHKEAGDGTLQPAKVDAVGPPPPPRHSPSPQQPPVSHAIGLNKVHPQHGSVINFGRPVQEITTRVAPHLNTNRAMTIGWDVHQRTHGEDRYNNHSPRDSRYKVEESGYNRNSKPWVRQSSFGNGGGSNGNSGGYPKAPPPRGLRVCKFYESGRCKKGASCNYWHP
ncbi:hypothetical protein QVD17_25076 [Tagetes erecta]|uniref:Zinc finger CCCH domain-containing protein 44 n=1 Tax=Tagetes erecta TaxID=13708 RepID=A0AAD8KM90_TARER|nr:hypothetical protein QVD17_25076 [Tagetes erecta]